MQPTVPEKQSDAPRHWKKLKAAKYAYVIVNGLVFLHYDNEGKNLLLTAPEVMDHVYYRGWPDEGHQLSNLERKIDLTTKGLLAGDNTRKPVFPPGVLQIPEDLTGPIQPERARCHVKLPMPFGIFCLRKGSSRDYHPTGKVGAAIKKGLRKKRVPEIGVITCLRYKGQFPESWTTSGFNVVHFYAENQFPCGMEHVNCALQEASKLFRNPSKFDLRMDTKWSPPYILPQDPHLPLGDDGELLLDELNEDVFPASDRMPPQPASPPLSSRMVPGWRGMVDLPPRGNQAGASAADCCQYGIVH